MRLAAIHRKALGPLSSGSTTVARDEESTRPGPAVDTAEQGSVVLSWDVREAVERDDGVEGGSKRTCVLASIVIMCT